MGSFVLCLTLPIAFAVQTPESVPKEHSEIYDKLQNTGNKGNLAGTKWPSPCDLEPGMNMPFCDYSLSFESRAWSLLNAMTINETLSQTSCWSGPVDRLNISFFGWWVDAAHVCSIYHYNTHSIHHYQPYKINRD